LLPLQTGSTAYTKPSTKEKGPAPTSRRIRTLDDEGSIEDREISNEGDDRWLSFGPDVKKGERVENYDGEGMDEDTVDKDD
jgi:hypothetical protein